MKLDVAFIITMIVTGLAGFGISIFEYGVEKIFYTTGMFVWVVVCASIVFTAFLIAVVFPIHMYKRARKYFWYWRYAIMAADTGLSQSDVTYAIQSAHYRPAPIEDMLKWFQCVKERGDSIKRETHPT